ncbi:hypothetical protein ACIQU1_22245 [Streptomyces angustmyceticus]|uniref:hypothetical protein n=1 Tax=Streptomyces angustmyceticus TaxID=285578 RepID=UPI0038266236
MARHRCWAADGTWDRVLGVLLARVDDDGLSDGRVVVDSTITRAHQHATSTRRPAKCRAAARGQGPDAHREPAGHAVGRSLPLLLGDLRVPRTAAGRPRTTPTMPLGDKAYSSRAIRAVLKARGITAAHP